MRNRINAVDLSRTDAETMLVDALHGEDMARLAAGISRGAHKRRATDIARQHNRNAVALADRLYGAPSAAIMAMSDADLAAALEA